MIHNICSHDVLEAFGDLCAFVVGPQVYLTEDDTEAWYWLNGVVQLPSVVVDEVSESSLKLLLAVEIEHACEEACVVIVHSVHTICVGTKIVSLASNILAKSEPRIETIYFPSAIKSLDSPRGVVFHSLPQELGQVRIIRHEPVVPSVAVHVAVPLRALIAKLLRSLHYSPALVR